MTIGGTLVGTNVGEYNAKFTLNPGYVFDGEDITIREAEVPWNIVPLAVDAPT